MLIACGIEDSDVLSGGNYGGEFGYSVMYLSSTCHKGFKQRDKGGVETAQTWWQVHILGARMQQKSLDDCSARYVSLYQPSSSLGGYPRCLSLVERLKSSVDRLT
jgi:hypothetical protein